MAVIDDKFSGEGADVDLDTHTPDTTGTGWTNVETTGAQSIFVETATPADVIRAEAAEGADRTIYSAQGTYPSNEYDVEVDVTTKDNDDDWAWLIGRLTDSSNYYAAGFAINVGADLRLTKKVANTFTNLGTADADWVEGDTIKFEIRDGAKKIFVNNVEKFSNADDALTSTGEGGIALGNIQNSSFDIGSGWDLDNFLVTEAAPNPSAVGNARCKPLTGI